MASLKNVADSLGAALDVFSQRVPADVQADVPGKAAILAAAERVRNEAGKVGLLCSGAEGASLSPAELTGLAAGLQQAAVSLTLLLHAASSPAGASLKKELCSTAAGVVEPCVALVRQMASGKDLKQAVGLVWEGVGGVGRAALDNKTCLFRALAGVLAVLKDTVREMEELQQQQQDDFGGPSAAAAAGAAAAAANGHAPLAAAAGDGGASSDVGSDLDFAAEAMTRSELLLLGASLRLLAASVAAIKAFGRALLQGPALAGDSEALDGWESCLFHARHLRRAAEDLGAAMYPPMDFDEVSSAALAVFEVTELMLDECPAPDAVGAEPLAELAAALQAAHDAMLGLLSEAQAEANNASA